MPGIQYLLVSLFRCEYGSYELHMQPLVQDDYGTVPGGRGAAADSGPASPVDPFRLRRE